MKKSRECEELKKKLRESQIESAISQASLDYLAKKHHIDLKEIKKD